MIDEDIAKQLASFRVKDIKQERATEEDIRLAETQITQASKTGFVASDAGVRRVEGNDHLLICNMAGNFNTKTNRFENFPEYMDVDVFKDVLRTVFSIGASDTYLQEDEPIKALLKDGKRRALTTRGITYDELKEVLAGVAGTNVVSRIQNTDTVPYHVEVPWTNNFGKQVHLRFRGNGTPTARNFGSDNGMTITLRKIGEAPPTFEDLNVSPEFANKLFHENGLVMVIGETNSGKSSLIASALRHMIEDRFVPEGAEPPGGALATYESPIEFLLRKVASPNWVVGQTDMTVCLKEDFAIACKDNTRRGSSVVFLGEVQTEGTARGLINMAQQGQLAYSTFHANNPMDFFNRFTGYFDHSQYRTIKEALIGCLKVIVCVRLLPTKDGKRTQIRGVMEFNREVRIALQETPDERFGLRIMELYKEQGNTMLDDLKRQKDRFSAELFEWYLREFEDKVKKHG